MEKYLTSEKLLQKRSTNIFMIANEAIKMAKDKIARGEEVTQHTLDRILEQLGKKQR